MLLAFNGHAYEIGIERTQHPLHTRSPAEMIRVRVAQPAQITHGDIDSAPNKLALDFDG